jgi:hypothetical protein
MGTPTHCLFTSVKGEHTLKSSTDALTPRSAPPQSPTEKNVSCDDTAVIVTSATPIRSIARGDIVLESRTHRSLVALLAETSRHPLASVTAPSRNVATWRVLSEFCEAVRVVVLTTILSDNRSSINVNGSQPWSCGTAKSDTLRPKRLPIHIRVGSAGERSRPPVQSFFVQLPHEPNRTEPN